MPTKKNLLIAVTIFLNACAVFKKSNNSSNNDLTVINLDTIESVASIPQAKPYQASFTRLNDIIHTKLDVSFDWTKQYLYGRATITVKPYFYPTSTLQLDARGMQIKEITLFQNTDGTFIKTPLKYIYENDIISIQLDKEYKNTEEYTVFIDYISKPNELKTSNGSAAITDDKGLYFINPDGKEKNKPQEIWTQGETQSNSVWFPTIDHPNERMTQEIYMTVNKRFVTLSNGELVSSFDNGDGTRTDYWKMDLPHAPYLAMMAVGDFAIVKDTWRGKEVSYYVEKEYEPYARNIFGDTPEMIEFFSNKLGVDYPWNKYSQIVARDYVSGAMENTTATLHSEYLQRTDRELLDKDYEDYVSHELFHQWFGDLVTCESWSNIPLNESFATYAEYLWQEYKYGRDAADEHSAESRAGYFQEALNKQVNLIRFQYDKQEDMFDAHSYNKGGQVLHMLRKYVGDDAFFASLKLYLETNKFNSVEIHNLRLAFEKVTGEDLNWFFNEWFLSPGHPSITIKTEYDASNKKEKIELKQTQDFSKTPLFKIPMYIDLYVNGKIERKKITVTKSDEIVEFDVITKPDLVNVDAEKMLLCNKIESKSIQEWAFQYKNAPLYLDRYEAISELAKNATDSLATKIIISALNDPFWSLRLDALEDLKNIQPGHEKEVKDKLIILSQKDEKSLVRAAAINYLSEHYAGADLEILYKNSLQDRSYSVISSALAAIAKENPSEAIIIAKQYESEKNMDLTSLLIQLYANYGSDENNNFFIRSSDKFTGNNKIEFISIYGLFLKRAKKDETISAGIDLLISIVRENSTNKWIVLYTKKVMKDLMEMYNERIKTLQDLEKNSGTKELESEIENVKIQQQKITEILNLSTN
jgi:aminopeptidase N